MSGRGGGVPIIKEKGELPAGSQHHGGSFRKYMEHKNEKLQEQFQALGGRQRSELFRGVSIHVNGLTNPSQQELKQLMALHGGKFQLYYSRSAVTHIICSHLPDAKVKQFERERNPTPVVRPEWIVDSLQGGKRLPIQSYLLWSLRDAPGQRTLLGFQQPTGAVLPPSAIYGTALDAAARTAQQQAEQSAEPPPRAEGSGAGVAPAGAAEQQQQQQLQQGGTVQEQPSGPDSREALRQQLNETHHPQPQQQQQQEWQQQQQQPPRQPSPDPDPPDGKYRLGTGSGATEQQQQQQQQQREWEEAQRAAAQMRAECDLLRGAPKSTRDDPHFVESFHRSSRLHFIGTWKARFESLMPTLVVDAPSPTPHAMARQRTIIHIDMDCFFASVAEASNPLFKGKPLAVCHSASAKGTGEVSSANYEARRYGVAASMFIARAKELCPQLIVVPYEFDKYEAASEKAYRILAKYSSCVQPLSCDEAFVDVTGLGDPQDIASRMRADIQAATGCTASAGIGPNLLLARLATRRAKPNGQWQIKPGEAKAFLAEMEVGSLPSVGWATEQKLKQAGMERVSDMQARSKEALQQLLGAKTGVLLWEFAHGRDTRQVEPPKARKSVGAEVNWGVRFDSEEDAIKMVRDLAAEVQERLRAAGVRGRTLTLKLKKRKEGAGEPVKFLGCGECDNLSRSSTLARFTDSAEELACVGRDLLRALRVPPREIRGVGLAVSRLDNDSTSAAAKPNAAPPASNPWAAFYREGQARAGPAQQSAPGDDHPAQGGQVSAAAAAAAAAPAAASPRPGSAAAPATAPAGNLSAVLLRPGGSGAEAAEEEGEEEGWEEDSEGEDDGWPEGGAGASPRLPPQQGQQVAPAPAQRAQQAAAAAPTNKGPSLEERRRLLARYEGATLTQIDAAELAELPWSVQKELIDTLPRTSADAGAGRPKQPGGQRALPAAHAAAAAAATAAAGVAAEAAAEDSGGAEVAAGGSAEGSGEPSEAEAGPSRQAAGGGGSSRSSSPIQALPSFSQLDQSVLDALPLHLKRELEAAYGIGRHQRSPPKTKRGRPAHVAAHSRPMPKRQRLDSFLSAKPPHGQGQQQQQQPTSAAAPGGGLSSLQRAPAAGSSGAAGRGDRAGTGPGAGLSLSQVDPSVLEELPADLQKEILAQLTPGGLRRWRKRQRAGPGPSRLGLAAAAGGAAWEGGREAQRVQQAGDAVMEEAGEAGEGEGDGGSDGEPRQQFELPEALRQWAASLAGERSAACSTPGQLAPLLEQSLRELEQRWAQQGQQEGAEGAPSQGEPLPSDGEEPGYGSQAEQAAAAAEALRRCLIRGCTRLVAGRLDELKSALAAVQRQGRRHAWFWEAAGRVVRSVQGMVEAEHGWQLRLGSLLEEEQMMGWPRGL